MILPSQRNAIYLLLRIIIAILWISVFTMACFKIARGQEAPPTIVARITITWDVPIEEQRCNTHQRKLRNPFTWLKSNMCDEDYQAWVAPRRKDSALRDKKWWIGETVIILATALDAATTAYGQGKNPQVLEGNPILGLHPSNGRVAGFSLLSLGVNTGLHYGAYRVSHNDPSKVWRFAGEWSMPTVVAAINGRQGINNAILLAGWKAYPKPPAAPKPCAFISANPCGLKP